MMADIVTIILPPYIKSPKNIFEEYNKIGIPKRNFTYVSLNKTLINDYISKYCLKKDATQTEIKNSLIFLYEKIMFIGIYHGNYEKFQALTEKLEKEETKNNINYAHQKIHTALKKDEYNMDLKRIISLSSKKE
jgi:DNA/RNA endonuclease G (NUC1)